MHILDTLGRQCAQKVIFFIKNSANKELLKVYEKALGHYVSNSYLRKRRDAFQSLIDSTSEQQSSLLNLSEFAIFMTGGDITYSSSAQSVLNHVLYEIGIDTSDLPASILVEFLTNVYQKLREIIMSDIAETLENVVVEEEEELSLAMSVVAALPTIALFSELHLAQKFLQDNKEFDRENVYVIKSYPAKKSWSVYWFDLLNRPNLVEPSEYLSKLLGTLPDFKLPEAVLDKYDYIKYACSILPKNDHIYIFNSQAKATVFANEHPNKLVFFLVRKLTNEWVLTESNTDIKVNLLSASPELAHFLKNHITDDFPTTEEQSYAVIKLFCGKIAQSTINKISVHVSELEAKDLLAECDGAKFCSSYVLTKDVKLYWFNTLGKSECVKFSTTAQLAQWHASYTDTRIINNKTIEDLKFALRNVVIKNSISSEKKLNLLSFFQRTVGINLVILYESNFVGPQPCGTFILQKTTIQPISWRLYQYKDALEEQEISPELRALLQSKKNNDAKVFTDSTIGKIKKLLNRADTEAFKKERLQEPKALEMEKFKHLEKLFRAPMLPTEAGERALNRTAKSPEFLKSQAVLQAFFGEKRGVAQDVTGERSTPKL